MSSEHAAVKRKPANWCGTKISYDQNKAGQAPINAKMPAFPEGKRYYPCTTQNNFMPTIGELPKNPNGRKWDSGEAGLMVGNINLIPRWAKPANLLYYVVSDGFGDNFEYV
jgi:hypothetical protein